MAPRLLSRGTTSCPPGELRLHPEASLVPEMTPAEYDELRRDIERRGLLVPLEVTPRRVVLDGSSTQTTRSRTCCSPPSPAGT
jgi:hypothetical protein